VRFLFGRDNVASDMRLAGRLEAAGVTCTSPPEWGSRVLLGKGIGAVASPSGSFACTALGQVAGLGTWHHLVVHVVANGSASTAEAWFDAQLLYSSNKVGTGDTALTSVQLGAGHPSQMGDSYLDDITITAR
jgi:hypothetical protein